MTQRSSPSGNFWIRGTRAACVYRSDSQRIIESSVLLRAAKCAQLIICIAYGARCLSRSILLTTSHIENVRIFPAISIDLSL